MCIPVGISSAQRGFSKSNLRWDGHQTCHNIMQIYQTWHNMIQIYQTCNNVMQIYQTYQIIWCKFIKHGIWCKLWQYAHFCCLPLKYQNNPLERGFGKGSQNLPIFIHRYLCHKWDIFATLHRNKYKKLWIFTLRMPPSRRTCQISELKYKLHRNFAGIKLWKYWY